MANDFGFKSPPTNLSPGVPQFGVNAPDIQTVRIELDDAQEVKVLGVSGTFFWVYRASDKDAVATIHFNSNKSNGLPFSDGQMVRGIKFSECYVTNTAQAGKWLDVMCVVEDAGKVEIINPGQTFANIDITKPTGIETVADVTVAATSQQLLLAADSTRRIAHIHNLSNTFHIRVGDSNVAAARGVSLDPDIHMEFETTDAIYAYNGEAVPIVVSITYTTD